MNDVSHDLGSRISALNASSSAMRAEFNTSMSALRDEFNASISALRDEYNASISALRWVQRQQQRDACRVQHQHERAA
jgi:hypothetical protein